MMIKIKLGHASRYMLCASLVIGCPIAFVKAESKAVGTLIPIAGNSSESYSDYNPPQTIRGLVTDNNGTPLKDVTVRVVGKNITSISDEEGVFVLPIIKEEEFIRLQLSSVGYKTQTLLVKENREVRVKLERDYNNLDEVVVVGYGEQKRKDLTGAISSVKGDDVVKTGMVGIDQALQGKLAGVSIHKNSAQPGGGIDILVRGASSVNASNTPLVIIDGIPISQVVQPENSEGRTGDGTQSPLNFLNPNDVESIEVLKDASATAIYGSRAANGVILITTKRGKAGKAEISFSNNFSIQQKTDTYEVLDLTTWMQSKNEIHLRAWSISNGVAPYGKRTFSEAQTNPVNGIRYSPIYKEQEISEAGPGTDWVGMLMRNGSIQESNVNVSGGTDVTRYFVSANFFNQNGIIKSNGVKRYTGKVNLDQRLSKYFKTNVNFYISRFNNDNVMFGDGAWGDKGALVNAAIMDPSLPVFDANGEYSINPMLPNVPNPLSMLTITDNGSSDRFLGGLDLIYTPFSGLMFKLNAALDRSNRTRNTYHPRTYIFGARSEGMGSIRSSSDEFKRIELLANYNKTFREKHNLEVMYGTSYETSMSNAHYLKNTNFLSDIFLWYNLGAGSGIKTVASGASQNNRLSHFARLNFGIDNSKYLITGTFRADGASQFAKNHKWGYFPSVAVGWNLHQESFMQFAQSKLSQLKLRLSYGQTGNASIGDNAFAAYIPDLVWNNDGGGQVFGVRQNRLENPDLKWETTSEYNLGIDFGLFSGRVSGNIELYTKQISDLLNTKQLNRYHDVNTVTANLGVTQSKGVEVTLNTVNVSKDNFKWSTSYIFSFYRDRWKKRVEGWNPDIYQSETDPVRPIYSYRYLGILQMGEPIPDAQPDILAGSAMLRDLDGYKLDENGNKIVDANGRFVYLGKPDGKIDYADMQLIGTTDPGYIIGLSNTMTYKKIDFTFNLHGMLDRIMRDPNFFIGDGAYPYGYNMLKYRYENTWTVDDPGRHIPHGTSVGMGDFEYQKAWFIRLQNVGFGYTFAPKADKRKVINQLRAFVNVNNLLVLTPYTGLDPETDMHWGPYPNARTFSFGLNINF
ncbi:SusC/RagA family TonB-linked outer membrane protein [Sphingobacterium faecale]|uniref:TonB-dependent receptor n=1 Tax=Sphingobacterium faecale TaxID=2803775 RepID=A0ABS1R3D9_9SPHI|nr:TonB-dependent receptor [Sphingobacterium faecale]MBL1408744.1 TonB-dependent receptor [Sphingobacterium faecale]